MAEMGGIKMAYQQRRPGQGGGQNPNQNKINVDLEVSRPIKEKDKILAFCKATVTKGGSFVPDDSDIEIYDDQIDPTNEKTLNGVAAKTFEYDLNMAGQEITFTAIYTEGNKPTKKIVKKTLLKKEEEKEKKPEVRDFSKVLTVIASIRGQDVLMRTTKKIEEWMREMGPEREIVFTTLCKLPQERIEPIIKQIISKLSHHSRREIADSYGLYSMDINTERYSKIILEVEKQSSASIMTIEKWLETLTPCQANYFKSSLSGMKTREGVERYIYLSQLPTDTERIKKSTTLNLLFM